MKDFSKQVTFLKRIIIGLVLFVLLNSYLAFKAYNSNSENSKFGTINVERINVVEADGTVKMVITNVEQFPNGKDSINNRATNVKRKKRSGMLFYNEDGIEAGGFIYDGRKKEDGHSAGMSLTFDQYDGDQLVQLLSQDYKRNGQRRVSSSLIFNDQPLDLSNHERVKLVEELENIKDRKLRMQKYQEYLKDGKVMVSRMMVGKTGGGSHGVFLKDSLGKMRGMFYIDTNNRVKLVTYDENGKIAHSWPN